MVAQLLYIVDNGGPLVYILRDLSNLVSMLKLVSDKLRIVYNITLMHYLPNTQDVFLTVCWWFIDIAYGRRIGYGKS